jgi:hypothetical protein
VNARAIDALKSIITNLGGSVPVPSDQTWNEYTLALLDAAITAAGGTPYGRPGNWNGNFVGSLERLAATVTTSAQSSLATQSFTAANARRLADYTQADPNGVLLSVSDTTINGTAGYLLVGLTKSTQASFLPKGANAGVSWSVSGTALNGTAMDADIYDLLTAVALWAGSDTPPVDFCIGAALADTVAASSTSGFGVRLAYSGGLWLVSHLTCNAGTWSASAATATSASIVGAIGQSIHAAAQRQIRARGMASDGTPVTTSSTSSTATSIGAADNLNTLILYAGWMTGGVGSNGAQCALRGMGVTDKFTNITGFGR